MGILRKTWALVAWLAIYVPTTLFVTAVMFKSIWATSRGKVFMIGGLVAVPAAILAVRSIGGHGRNLA